ncbi:MAG: hypothetical protein ACI94Y_000212 [Maribacter sp.]|jgi:hypothetical protein
MKIFTNFYFLFFLCLGQLAYTTNPEGPHLDLEPNKMDVEDLSWLESFENSGLSPSDWTVSYTGNYRWLFKKSTPSGSTGPQAGDHTSGSGYFAFTEASSSYSGAQTTLTSPVLDISSIAFPKLVFWYNMYGNHIGSLDVEVSTDGISWDNIFTLSGNQGSSWTEIILPLGPYVGSTSLKMRFIGTRGSGSRGDIAIDDVTIINAPSCSNPSELIANNVTSTSAELTWIDENLAPPAAWEIKYGPIGFNQGGVNELNGILDNPYILSNLLPDTSYEFYVRANCGSIDGKSEWSGPFTFTTMCNPFTTPYCEGFDSNSNVESCWTVIDANNDGDSWSFDNNTTNSGDESVHIYTDDNEGNDDYLISPPITLTGSESLQFWHSSAPSNFEVLLSTSGNHPSDFTNVLIPNTSYSNTSYQEQVISLDSYTGNIFIAFHIPSGENNGYSLHLDDICITSCIAPSIKTPSEISQTTAKPDWIENNNANSWDIEWGEAGFELGTGTILAGINTNQHYLTELTSDTEYDYYVRSNCGSNGSSNWSEKSTFKTLCNVFTTPYCENFNANSNDKHCWTVIDANNDGDSWQINSISANAGNESAYINTNSNQGYNDDYLISPPIALTGSELLQFWHKVASSSTTNNFEVLLSTSGNHPSDFTNVLIPNASYSNTSYQEEVIDLSSYSGNIFIAFHIPTEGNDGYYLSLDNICITSCLAPSIETASEISQSTADLHWIENNSATSWDIEWGEIGFIEGTGTTITGINANPYHLSNLLSDTKYDYYVRSNCDNNGSSNWSEKSTFKTLCDVLTTPYCESFDTGSSHESCWTVIDANNDGNSWLLNSSASHSGDKGVQISTDGNGGNNDDYLISPQITLTGSELLQFWYRSGSYNEPNNFEVLLSTTGNSPSDFTNILLPNSTCYYTIYQEHVIDLNEYTGNVFIAFHIPNEGNDGHSFYLDDICISSCLSAINGLNAINITSNSADLTWNSSSDETSWDIELGIAGTALGTGTLSNHNSTNYSATNLIPSALYQFYARTKCDNYNNSAWYGPYYFNTNCGSIDPIPLASSASIGCNESTIISSEYLNDRQVYIYADALGTELLGEAPYTASPTSTTTYYLVETPTFSADSGIYIDKFLTEPDIFEVVIPGSGLTGSYEIVISNGYDDINSPNSVSHVLVDPTPGSYSWIDDEPSSPNFWGENIDWKVGEGDENGGWIMIVDITIPTSPVIMDAVFWSYTEETIQSFNITTPQGIVITDSGWNGHGVNHSCGNMVVRNTQSDADNISNWMCGGLCMSNLIPITINVDPCVVASGTTNECTGDNGGEIIDGAGETGEWINIKVGGDIIAAIENTENLGLVTASFYKHSNGNRISGSLQNLLSRNITITVSNQPANPVKVRLFFMDEEYNDLITANEATHNTSNINDLLITKYPNGNCSTTHTSAGLGAELVPNARQGLALNGSFIETTVSSFSEFFFHESGDNIPLPVELIKFEVEKIEKHSLLTWETASETNNAGFYAQRSSNGVDFENINWTEATGNSSTLKKYEVIDRNPSVGLNYYRIAQEDFDGTINYSNIKKILFDAQFNIVLSPNPSKVGRYTNIKMNTDKNQKVYIDVFDMSGQMVISIQEDVEKGESNIKLPHDNLTAGMYFVSIKNSTISKSIKLSLIE